MFPMHCFKGNKFSKEQSEGRKFHYDRNNSYTCKQSFNCLVIIDIRVFLLGLKDLCPYL
jgi:hypothetical protein